MAYTAAELAIVCPKCHGVGKCLEKNTHGYGMKWIETPHSERVQAAKEKTA